MQSEERGDQELLRRESERSERAAVVSEANGVAWAHSDGREADDCIVAVGKRRAGEPKPPFTTMMLDVPLQRLSSAIVCQPVEPRCHVSSLPNGAPNGKGLAHGSCPKIQAPVRQW